MMVGATSSQPGPTATALVALVLFAVSATSFALMGWVTADERPDVVRFPFVVDTEAEPSDPRGPLIGMSVVNPIRPRST